MSDSKLAGGLYVFGLAAAIIIIAAQWQNQKKQAAANAKVVQATTEDVLVGNNPVPQQGGFGPVLPTPTPSSVLAAHGANAGKPRGAAVHHRAKRGGRQIG